MWDVQRQACGRCTGLLPVSLLHVWYTPVAAHEADASALPCLPAVLEAMPDFTLVATISTGWVNSSALTRPVP